jgi:hypothetical protein
VAVYGELYMAAVTLSEPEQERGCRVLELAWDSLLRLADANPGLSSSVSAELRRSMRGRSDCGGGWGRNFRSGSLLVCSGARCGPD